MIYEYGNHPIWYITVPFYHQHTFFVKRIHLNSMHYDEQYFYKTAHMHKDVHITPYCHHNSQLYNSQLLSSTYNPNAFNLVVLCVGL